MARTRHEKQREHNDARRRRVQAGTTVATLDWQCPLCRKWFARHHGGSEKHWTACEKNAKKKRDVDRLRRKLAAQSSLTQDVEEHDLEDHPMSSPRPAVDEGLSRRGTDDIRQDHRSEHDGPFRLASPVGNPSIPDVVRAMDNMSLDRPNQPSVSSAQTPDALDPVSVPLGHGETLIVYHPHARRPASIVSRDGHVRPAVLGSRLPDPGAVYGSALDAARPEDAEALPWAPFHTRADFEQAELFVRYHCTDSYINQQLRLIHQSSASTQITLKNAAEIHTILDIGLLTVNLDSFSKGTLTLPFEGEDDRSYDFRWRDANEVLLQSLEDKGTRSSKVWYPEQHYVRRPGTANNMRVWSEAHTADDWWDLQNSVGPDRVVIYLIFYSDATALNSFGTAKAWNAYVWIGNNPRSMRLSNKKGRAILVGFLPKVPGERADNSSRLAEHRVEVYQAAIARIFENCKLAAQYGTPFEADPDPKTGVYCLAVAAMDYEEAARAAGILGSQSEHACPVCLVPRGSLGDLCSRVSWPKRTKKGTEQLLLEAASMPNKTRQKKKLGEQSLRNIQNLFLLIFGWFLCIFSAFSVDPLHQIEQGAYGQHIWPWLLDTVLNAYAQQDLDQNFKSIPPFPNIPHFHGGITSLKYITAREHNAILRYLAPRMAGISPVHEALVMPVLRSLACVLLLIRLEVQTEATLELLEAQIDKYGEACKALEEAGLGIAFGWPKQHSFKHAVELLKRKGAASNGFTDMGEALHPVVKSDWRGTNHQPDTAEDQMFRKAQERDVIMHIRHRVDQHDDETDIPKDEHSPIRDIRLGSPQRSIQIHAFRHNLHNIIPPDRFNQQLQHYLGHVAQLSLEDINLDACRVVPHHAARIPYICEVTAQEKDDIIHVAPNWRHKGPRHDCVVIQGRQAQSHWFAKVISLFTLKVGTELLHLAFVGIYVGLGRNSLTDYLEL
ncbi:uncharacterized protein B0H18DRAFT_1207855, partial [Fomitopsis serialis]|uniref:uncharacterized protein n=1 Tax=Fomitopsis serialis TaxID=139415 RepID=UPI002007A81C